MEDAGSVPPPPQAVNKTAVDDIIAAASVLEKVEFIDDFLFNGEQHEG